MLAERGAAADEEGVVALHEAAWADEECVAALHEEDSADMTANGSRSESATDGAATSPLSDSASSLLARLLIISTLSSRSGWSETAGPRRPFARAPRQCHGRPARAPSVRPSPP